MKTLQTVGWLAAVAMLVALLTLPMGVRADDNTITFGIIQPLTSQGAEVGHGLVKGFDLAIKEINDHGGVLGGKKLKYIIEDDQCSPPVTVSAARKLIDQDGVKIIVGSMCSSTTLAIIPVTQAAKVLQVVPQSFNPTITQRGDPYLFRTSINSDIIADTYADFIANKKDTKTIALLGVNDDFGRAQMAAFIKRFKKYGHPKVVAEEYFRFQDRDFSTYLTKIRQLNPEAMYIIARTPQNAMIINQMAEMHFRPVVYGNANFTDQGFIDLAKGNAEGIIALSDWSKFVDTPTNQHFYAAYKAMYHEEPSADYASAGYNAIRVLAAAINKAGTATDVPKLAETFHNLSVPINTGTMTFNKEGQGSIGVFPVSLKDGVYRPIKGFEIWK